MYAPLTLPVIFYCAVLCYLSFSVPPPSPFFTLSLHDALPISMMARVRSPAGVSTDFWAVIAPLPRFAERRPRIRRSEEHTSELQSRGHLVCRLLLEKKKPYRSSLA